MREEDHAVSRSGSHGEVRRYQSLGGEYQRTAPLDGTGALEGLATLEETSDHERVLDLL